MHPIPFLGQLQPVWESPSAWNATSLFKGVSQASARLLCAIGLTLLTAEAAAATEHAEWQWRDAQPLPEARTEVSVTSDGDFVYLLGGMAAGRGEERASAPTAVFRYDPAADRWSELQPLSEGVHHAGLAYMDGQLFLIGGYSGASGEPLAEVRILDLASAEWRRGVPMPSARGALAVAVLDGRIHAVGGRDGSKSVSAHEIYDPASDQWTEAAAIASPRNHHAAAVLNGRLFVFGGRDEETAEMTATEVYNAETDRWDSAPPMPTGRSGIAAAAIEGKAIVFGGETFGANTKTFDEAELYDPELDQWRSLPPMPQSRHGLGAARVGSRIHVIAGGPTPGLSFSSANTYLEAPASGNGIAK